MSAFSALSAQAFSALDSAFGEPLLVTAQLKTEFISAGPNPSQPAFTVVGILDDAGVVADDSGRKVGERSDLMTTKPQVDFDESQFGAAMPRPVKGTIITAVTRPGSPRYVVLDRLPDGVGGVGRAVYQLEKIPE